MSLFEDLPVQDSISPNHLGERVWQLCLPDLQFAMADKDYRQWIAPLKAEVNDTELLLLAPNMMWVRHVKDNYLSQITDLTYQHGKGVIKSVRIEMVASTIPNDPATKKAKTNKKTSKKTGVVEGLPIDPGFTFDVFIKGKSNASAYNACNELSRKESKHNYGPIFIYGSSGLGKTHLMHAMAHRYQKYGKQFFYFTKDHFYKITLEAFRTNDIVQMEKEICQADLLIIDDVHMVSGSKAPKVTEILMKLFDTFSAGNTQKQVVLASDRPPSQMTSFGERYISRLSSCLQLSIEPPDMEMRIQILEKKAQMLNLLLPRECALYMAQNLPPDVRGLEGALKRVQLSATILRNEPVSLPLVKDAIKDQVQARARALNAENIRDLVAEYYEISPKDLMSKKRARYIARPRQMAMALIRELTRDSFPEIGQVFGGRDHTTVMHACEKIEELRTQDAKIQKDYHSLKMMLEYV
ncbi:chromosomal replication initiator protein DnaA [Moraxella catarrhalis]|uniref:chromosomal replication initiator protein DnaA n=1 Tax=Moraxella catarrhalis TaxID=480 RepID=UPI000EA8DE7D|nr:chromosomal replication initiator protein DnaA [Moraxella catarrhalis]RKM12208.1 chromosomal replication initiator protein DnaA [Moraxella catarrhalis]RKM14006.1 chromosomal replication initiator protein DnaA [Moraxella catarrhalis]